MKKSLEITKREFLLYLAIVLLIGFMIGDFLTK